MAPVSPLRDARFATTHKDVVQLAVAEHNLHLTNCLMMVHRTSAAHALVLGVACVAIAAAARQPPPVVAPTAAAAIPTPAFPWFNPNLPIDQRLDMLMAAMNTTELLGQVTKEAKAIPRLGIPAYSYW